MPLVDGRGHSMRRNIGLPWTIGAMLVLASTGYSTPGEAWDGQEVPPPITLTAPPVDRSAHRLPGSEWLIGLPADRVAAVLAKGLQIKTLNPATSQSDGSIEVVTDRCYVLIETSLITADGSNLIEHVAPVVSHVAGLKQDWSALTGAEAQACGVSLRPPSG